MKIVALTAENVKKLVAVHIKPDGNVVQITGRNGQGKTSVLDAIWWALAGADHIQSAPIRKGAKEARIRLDLGEIVVTRKFRSKEEGGATTTITVENADGSRFPSPQRMLDDLLGALTFDPLAFSRMKPKEQFNILRGFVPDVDFDEIENAQRGDFQRRTDINRQAKEKRGAAATINIPENAPTERRDEAALVAELKLAGEANAEIEQRKLRREQATQKVADNKARAASLAAEAAERERRIIEQRDQRLAELRAEMEKVERQATEDVRLNAANTGSQIKALEEETSVLQKRLDEAPPLPEPVDTEALALQIASARDNNELVARREEKAKLEKEAEDLEAQSDALTARMKKREDDKRAAIAAAKLPVEGLGFGDGVILMNGVPFDQASDAEQLRTSIAIAMASNPKLRVIRVRDGSLLDEDAMKLIAEMADGNDYQVWIEKVDSSGKIGFVLEDGRLKGAEAEAAAAAE